MSTVLEIRNLKKYYGTVKAVEDVSFSVKQGELVVIIGPSGAGKSTVLRCINRMIDATDGSICFEGTDITKFKKEKDLKHLRRKIGMIFQSFNLVYRLSVFQNVLHGRLGYMSQVNAVLGRYSEEDKKKALAILEKIGLKDMIYKRAGELSGGQKQRVGIARAIMQQPKVLLCDEPIASLDPSSAKTIMDLLKGMSQKRNIACIVNLHQLDVALKYSTRIIGLSKGEIVFDGTPEELTDEAIERIYNTSRENLMIGVGAHGKA